MAKLSRYRLLALATCGVAASLVVMVWLSAGRSRPGVTPANISAICAGMTYPEVESLMGCPSGTIPLDAPSAVESLPESLVLAPRGRAGAGHHWIGPQVSVFVVFDADGKVEEVRPLAVIPSTRTPWWQFW